VTALAGLASLVLAWGLGAAVIPLLRRLKVGQQIREVGPARHLAKQGTPTMGGVIFVVPALAVVWLVDWRSPLVWGLTVLVLGHALVGFADDFQKVVRHRSLGLRAREKLLYQILLGLFFAWFAARYMEAAAFWVLPWHGRVVPGLWYYPLAVLAVVGSGNAVNITDGLDGLAGGAMALALIFFVLWGLFQRDAPPGLATVAMAFLGAVVAFLRYNLHPAKVMMGDTGSLALGALLAGLALASRTVLVLPVLAGLFVIEALSVIVQVTSFKLTGRRVLRMSPLHHHFELSGWSEERVVVTFWLVGLVCLVGAWVR
jgi:phospho-N-acetylmuramoyl-pentapeptide-transferase